MNVGFSPGGKLSADFSKVIEFFRNLFGPCQGRPQRTPTLGGNTFLAFFDHIKTDNKRDSIVIYYRISK